MGCGVGLWYVLLFFASCAFIRCKELRYYTSREGASICRADGMSPYRGYMKTLYCTDIHAGTLCENDKFCIKPGEKCICNAQCMQKRCKNPRSGKSIVCIHGTVNDTRCMCETGWNGKDCSQDINECKRNICNPKGTFRCTNTPGHYNCTCKTGWEGRNCEIDHDDCIPLHCKNGAFCEDKTGWYFCRCKNGFVGKTCDMKCPQCHNSTCQVGNDRKPFCFCGHGLTGTNCQDDLNECKVYRDLCANGVCKNNVGSYKCECNAGWEGQHCRKKRDYCDKNPCKNHGLCLNHETKFTCMCPDTYTGHTCERHVNSCDNVTCHNGGKCHNITHLDFKCICPQGFNGTYCEKELPCHKNPCKNNGTCTNVGDKFTCKCMPGWIGVNCNKTSSCIKGICKNGGHCSDVGDTFNCTCLYGFVGKYCEKKICTNPKCLNPSVRHGCRAECNNYECGWDNTTCTGGRRPWEHCKAHKCWQKFADGKCNQECNNATCLFDGKDCDVVNKCLYEDFCKKSFLDGKCESKCNTKECNWDGMECDQQDQTKEMVPGFLIITLQTTKAEFANKRIEFVRHLSKLLNTHVIIEEVIDVNEEPVRKRRAVYSRQRRLSIKMGLDNQKCKRNCFRTTKAAADYIAAKNAKGKLGLPFKVVYVKSSTTQPSPPSPPPISPLWVVICVAVPLLLLGVIAFSRKVVARLWHPEGDNRFAVNDMRREPLGQEGDEMTNLQRRESVSGGSHVSPSGSCSDSPNSVGDAKRMKVEMVGSLGGTDWLNVKGVLREQADASEGVVRLSSASNDSTVHVDPCCGDTDGETNLHIAARLAKTELARQLIEFGVDINARNKSGKTSLHLAVSSLADGVFNLLIRNRACQIDVQDYEGRTSLMSACHCCHNMMVDELISNGAKVNLVDSQGKTALHCAAMVDNHKAVLVLLKNGAKVDAQDNKGQTPLFLAARDGAYTTAYVLLANYANRNCADSMDVTPLAISHQRGQKDLVALLSDWTGSPPGLMTSPSRNSPPDLSSPSSGTISPTPISQYSDIRPKLPNNNYGQIANGHCNNPIKPPMKRKRKSTKSVKEKTVVVEKSHPSFLNNYPANISDIFPSPRSSMDKREVCLPDLNSGEILEGMNAIYPPLDQINSLPTNWSTSIVGGGGHGPGHGQGHGQGHHQYNNPMVPAIRQYQFPPQTFYNNSHDSCHMTHGRSFPTPPSVGVESPNDIGSPCDQINVLPSPFLTPSPDTWSNSPGNSDNSG